MAKGKKGSKDNPVTTEELADLLTAKPKRGYVIINALIKDDFCNYRYEITEGIPDGHNVDGKGIIKDDMRNAFQRLNVHLAALDDAYRISGTDITNIDLHHTDEIAGFYHVTGFKIKGGKDNESISLIGTKYSKTCGGRLNISGTPFIPMDTLSSYKWYNELRVAADGAREEVALYKEGKSTPVEKEDEEETKKKRGRQLTIASPEAAADIPEYTVTTDDDFSDDEFESARV